MPYRKNKKDKEIFRKNRLQKNMGYSIIKKRTNVRTRKEQKMKEKTTMTGIEKLREKNKREDRLAKLIAYGMVLCILAGFVGFGYYRMQEEKKIEAEKKKEREIEAARLAEETKKAEEAEAAVAAEKARQAAERAAKEREALLQKIAAEKAAEAAKEKAALEAEKKEESKAEPTESPVTITTSKTNVTEKAKITDQKQPENKVVPKPTESKPSNDVAEHVQAERQAEQKAKEDPAAPPVNQSGNGIAANNDPDNPLNHLQYSDIPPVYDETTMTDGSKYSTHIPGTGDKF